jgi:hypothetical protein
VIRKVLKMAELMTLKERGIAVVGVIYKVALGSFPLLEKELQALSRRQISNG